MRAPLDAPTGYRHATYTWRASSPALAVVVVAHLRVAVTSASLLTHLLPWRQALAPDPITRMYGSGNLTQIPQRLLRVGFYDAFGSFGLSRVYIRRLRLSSSSNAQV